MIGIWSYLKIGNHRLSQNGGKILEKLLKNYFDISIFSLSENYKIQFDHDDVPRRKAECICEATRYVGAEDNRISGSCKRRDWSGNRSLRLYDITGSISSGKLDGLPFFSLPDDRNSDNAFNDCTEALINSDVAKVCGPFFERDIMSAIDICVKGN